MHPFAEYLQAHNLEPLSVSVQAGVRYSTIWNAIKGKPITSAHAQKVQQAVHTLTGIPYTGPLAVIQEQTDTQPLPFPVKRVHLK
jgi:hypothetical protein